MGAGEGVAPLLKSLGNVADVGFKIAAEEEKQEALNVRKAREAKQAIVNEVKVGRLSGEFETGLAEITEDLKKQFWTEPQEVPEQLLEAGRGLADSSVHTTKNTAVSLGLAKRSNARLDSAVRSARSWAQGRQTQMAKNDLSATVTAAVSVAGEKGSPEALEFYMESKAVELADSFRGVIGVDAPKAVAAMKQDMARAWTLSNGDHDPIRVLAALADTRGPLRHLKAAERSSLKGKTKSSYDGLAKTRELQIIQEGLARNGDLYKSFVDGTLDARTTYSQLRALGQQKQAVKARLSIDQEVLSGLGISVQAKTPDEILEMIEEREKFVNAIEGARRRQTPFDAEGDPASEAALIFQVDKALKANKGKDLGEIVRQQARVAVALAEKKIRGGSATTLLKTMALALDTAAEKSEDLWGPNTWRLWRAPLETGTVELNIQFAGQFKALDQAAQNRIRLNYLGQFTTAIDAGGTVSGESARSMALRALALETGEKIPGVD